MWITDGVLFALNLLFRKNEWRADVCDREMLTGPHGEQWPAPEVGELVHVAAYFFHGAGETRPFVVLTRDLDENCTIREISNGDIEIRDIFELRVDGYTY